MSIMEMLRRNLASKAKQSAAGLVAGVALVAGLAATPSAQAEPGLTFDQDHDVIVLPDCDVAVRYNSKTFVPVKAKLMDSSYPAALKLAPEKTIKIWEDYESAGMKAAPEQVVIESYDSRKVGAFSFSRLNPDLVKNNRVREVQFTNERVAKETGLSEGAFHGITAMKSFEVVPKSGETPYYLYVMVSPPHTNTFVRKMRGTSRSFDFDPAVIVTQMRIMNTKDCVGNVTLSDATAAASAAPAASDKAASSDKKPESAN